MTKTEQIKKLYNEIMNNAWEKNHPTDDDYFEDSEIEHYMFHLSIILEDEGFRMLESLEQHGEQE